MTKQIPLTWLEKQNIQRRNGSGNCNNAEVGETSAHGSKGQCLDVFARIFQFDVTLDLVTTSFKEGIFRGGGLTLQEGVSGNLFACILCGIDAKNARVLLF